MQSEAARENGSQPAVNGKPRWPDWSGRTAVCIATGPSLTESQINRVKQSRLSDGCRVIAINEAGLHQYQPLAAPWADIMYAADRALWSHYQPKFAGLRVSGEAVEDVDTIPLKMLEPDEPMPREAGSVVSGGHSGFQAIGLALTLGVSRVVLLGFDCGAGPARNCHTNRPEQFKRNVNMGAWAELYNRVPREWPDVEVYNCSMISRITAFPKIELESIL